MLKSIARALVGHSFPQLCSEKAALLCLVRLVAACPCRGMRIPLTGCVVVRSAQYSTSIGLLSERKICAFVRPPSLSDTSHFAHSFCYWLSPPTRVRVRPKHLFLEQRWTCCGPDTPHRSWPQTTDASILSARSCVAKLALANRAQLGHADRAFAWNTSDHAQLPRTLWGACWAPPNLSVSWSFVVRFYHRQGDAARLVVRKLCPSACGVDCFARTGHRSSHRRRALGACLHFNPPPHPLARTAPKKMRQPAVPPGQ